MFLVDTEEGRIISDKELKQRLYSRRRYAQWLKENQVTLDQLPEPSRVRGSDHDTILCRQRAFGYTDEDLRILLTPMAVNGAEPVGSMGTDTPLACLSDKPQPLFHYFKQLFAQVTNPPIDPIREEMVMSLISYIGTERNILDETPQHCHTLRIPAPDSDQSGPREAAPRLAGRLPCHHVADAVSGQRRRQGAGTVVEWPVPPRQSWLSKRATRF